MEVEMDSDFVAKLCQSMSEFFRARGVDPQTAALTSAFYACTQLLGNGENRRSYLSICAQMADVVQNDCQLTPSHDGN